MSMISVLLGTDESSAANQIVKRWNDSIRPYCTGLEVNARDVFSICPGVVVGAGADQDSYTVSVLVNDDQLIRYANLDSISVQQGQRVDLYAYIGSCKNAVRLEYCTSVKGRSLWPVRISNLTFYKHDPGKLLTGEATLDLHINILGQPEHPDIMTLTPASSIEFKDNKGED